MAGARPPRRPGFFELTPGRRVFLAAAGVAAAVAVRYVTKAFQAGEKVEEAVNPPIPPPPPPPPANPVVALREADAALGRAERAAADRAAKARAAEWQVAQAEVHLRALDGRALEPAQEAERARLVERADTLRRALAERGR
jgi:hypothetical protein